MNISTTVAEQTTSILKNNLTAVHIIGAIYVQKVDLLCTERSFYSSEV
jgi:hypothetical protein